MMLYDIKIYVDLGKDRETIRDLNYSQREAILSVLVRHDIKFTLYGGSMNDKNNSIS